MSRPSHRAAVENCAAIDGNDVARGENVPCGRDAVNHPVVHGRADAPREAVISEERRNGTGIPDDSLGDTVQFESRDAGLRCVPHRHQRSADDRTRRSHRVEFTGAAERDNLAFATEGHYLPRPSMDFSARALTSSTSPIASTERIWSE